MSMVTILDRVADLWGTIPEIKTVFRHIPRVILDSECPAVVFFLGEASYNLTDHGDNDVLISRTVRAVVFVRPAYQGSEGVVQQDVEPLFDSLRDYLLARPGLEVPGEDLADRVAIYDAVLLGDGGYQVTPYPINDTQIKDFATIEFRVQIKDWVNITYQD